MKDLYPEGYFERAEGSNYTRYSDDPGWPMTSILVARRLPIGAKVLEVGCAKGYWIYHARQAGLEAYGIDISAYAIDNAVPVVREFVRREDAASRIDTLDTYDAVVSWEFFEHVPEDELDGVIENLSDVCKPGGLQLHRICLPDEVGEDHDHTHVTMHPREWWDKRFDSFGWVEEGTREFDLAFDGRDWAGRFFARRLPPRADD